MAGHSKWANIQHRKGVQDKKRAQMFAKFSREITVAAKLGGGDPAMNSRLRLAIAVAKAQSMPRDNIERAVKKGTGGGAEDNYESMRYEGYGPGGVAVIVETLTNNRNRTAGDVRACFTKHGGNLGETGSVGFMFDRIGQIIYPAAKATADAIFEAALDAGAQNVESNSEFHEITTAPDDFAGVNDKMIAKFGESQQSGLVWKPNITAQVGKEQAEALIELIDALEDNDDVQNVTTNFEVSDAVMEQLARAG
jgi:YebC/PmpR family DNA-binding regulatory protein